MSTWESIFVEELRKITFRHGDPKSLSNYVIMVLGVPSKAAEKKLDKSYESGPAIIGEYKGISVSIAPRKGGTIQLESFLRLIPQDKTEYIIGLGAVGALQDNIQIGDIIIPTEAVRGEGMTGYYYPSDVPAKPDKGLTDILFESSLDSNTRVHTGTIFTTGTLLHETDGLVEEWHNKGYLGVECEASALFLLSQYCGFKSALVLYVTDNPYKKEIFTQNFCSMLKAIRAQRHAVRTIFDTIVRIDNQEYQI